jgi:enoyl-CoA hydratase
MEDLMRYLSLEINNGIGLISIHRPEALNALNREIIDELDALLEQIRDDQSIRVLVLWSDKNFAAGSDIKSMVEMTVEEAADFIFTPTYNKLDLLDIPTIAGIEGYALGGALELAMACDIRFAAEGAKLGYPEINLGIMPGAGGTIRTPLSIGSPWAKELIFSGEIIDATRALQIGLVNRIYSDAELFAETMKFAEKLSRKAPLAMKLIKQTMREGLACADLLEGVDIEKKNWATLFSTEDQKEGMRAFIEKRKPEYKGK